MNPASNNLRQINRYLFLGILLVGSFATYQLIAAVHTHSTTTSVTITTPDPKAIISARQASSNAQILGIGSTHVRLKPGIYYILASNAGLSANKIITVDLNHTITINLKLMQPMSAPSRDSYTYQGLDELISRGVSVIQVEGLKQAVFQYIQHAHLPITNVTLSNIEVIPFNSHGTSSTTNINFNLSLGEQHSFIANMQYNSLTDVHLYLYDNSKTLVYDSGTIDLGPKS